VTHKRPVDVSVLTRVEGEGGLHVVVEHGRVQELELRIFEPPRFFEALLRGRLHTEPPDITARICGICPVAYQMSACAALERLSGVLVDGPIRALRQILYCGEWLQSHALHVYLLHAPDFLGCQSAIELAQSHREVVERGLRLKQTGNRILEVVGGRAIHPVNVRLGGFYRAPAEAELRALLEPLHRARDDALATVEWVSGFEFPDFSGGYELLALRHPTEYPVLDGRIASTGGLDSDVAEFDAHVSEAQVPHSTALHALLDGRPYLVGPLARFALNAERLRPLARRAAEDAGLTPPEDNPFRSIVVRAVEMVHACDLAVELVERYERPEPAALEVPPTAGIGWGATEAPRGLLVHHYETDGDGLIRTARIIPPTSQNQHQIERDLRRLIESDPAVSDLAMRCEWLVRSHDPCISCATHFLDVHIERENTPSP
jgi:coenzyme F420-reducing hydrogenase alpha subunit